MHIEHRAFECAYCRQRFHAKANLTSHLKSCNKVETERVFSDIAKKKRSTFELFVPCDMSFNLNLKSANNVICRKQLRSAFKLSLEKPTKGSASDNVLHALSSVTTLLTLCFSWLHLCCFSICFHSVHVFSSSGEDSIHRKTEGSLEHSSSSNSQQRSSSHALQK